MNHELLTDELTHAEKDILSRLAKGETPVEIACYRGISRATLKNHFASIFEKLRVKTREHAVAVAICGGVIE